MNKTHHVIKTHGVTLHVNPLPQHHRVVACVLDYEPVVVRPDGKELSRTRNLRITGLSRLNPADPEFNTHVGIRLASLRAVRTLRKLERSAVARVLANLDQQLQTLDTEIAANTPS